MEIRSFRVASPQASLDDLRDRLDRTRWTSDIPGDGPDSGPDSGDYGMDLDWVRRLAGYWRDGYDWRAAEARLNAHPQFITEIDGQDIHFLHVRSPEPDALPLILTHGWPGSVVEYLDVIGPLTEPQRYGGNPSSRSASCTPSSRRRWRTRSPTHQPACWPGTGSSWARTRWGRRAWTTTSS
jgi:epoxide hydrolase